MKKLSQYFVSVLFVVIGAVSHANAATPQGNMCNELTDQFMQAVHYHKMAVSAHNKHLKNIMIPVGHFTSYVGADEAYTIAETRMGLIAEQAQSTGCNKTTDVFAKYQSSDKVKLYSLNM